MECDKVDIKSLSFSDLYSMFIFVAAERNRGFSNFGADIKATIDKRYSEIEAELYARTYGCNPFKSAVINGANPVDVVKSFKPVEEKNFVVVKNEEKEETKEEEKVVTFVVVKNE